MNTVKPRLSGICYYRNVKVRTRFLIAQNTRWSLKRFNAFLGVELTRYKQSFTGCGSQRKQCSCYSTKTNIMLTGWSSASNWLRWETYTLKVVFVEHHTHLYVYVSQRSQIQFEDHAIYRSFRWVTTTHVHVFVENHSLWRFDM